MSNGYGYHAFLSYRRGRKVNGRTRDDKVEVWVRNFFERELEEELTSALQEPAEVFYDKDDIRTGDEWAMKIVQALRSSCCIVPVWSPLYFDSDWCLSEWTSFRNRGAPVILPVLWQPMTLPKPAQAVQYTDVSDYAYTAEAFRKSEDFLQFEKLIRRFAGDVAKAIQRAPKFDPQWKVVVPEVTDQLRTANVQRLHDLPDWNQLTVAQPSRIRRDNIRLSG